MFDLTGKCALVTGASGGIGGSIAKALNAQGATVALSGTRVDSLNALAAELGDRAFVTPCNLGDAEAVSALAGRAIEAMGDLHILVNNAAVERNEPAHRATAAAIDETLLVYLRQAFMLCSAFAKDLFATQGNIVNVSSTAAAGAGGSGWPPPGRPSGRWCSAGGSCRPSAAAGTAAAGAAVGSGTAAAAVAAAAAAAGAAAAG